MYSVKIFGMVKSLWVKLELLEIGSDMILLYTSFLIFWHWFPNTFVNSVNAKVFLIYISFLFKLVRYSLCFLEIQSPIKKHHHQTTTTKCLLIS